MGPDATVNTMPPKKTKRDTNQLAKLIVDMATGEEPIAPPPSKKNRAAVELGKLGGKKGGRARAEKLTPVRRAEIASIAAKARWKNDN